MIGDIADAIKVEVFICRDEYRLVLNEYLLERRYCKPYTNQPIIHGVYLRGAYPEDEVPLQ